jgi:uncharacterized membrane protein YidH (DUF202 family)
MSERVFRLVSGALALVSLGVCLAALVLFFMGRIAERTYKTGFLLASIAWFILATAWATAGKHR